MCYTAPLRLSRSSLVVTSSAVMFANGSKVSSFIKSTSSQTVVIDVVPDIGPDVTLGVAEVTEGVDVAAPVVETEMHNISR